MARTGCNLLSLLESGGETQVDALSLRNQASVECRRRGSTYELLAYVHVYPVRPTIRGPTFRTGSIA